MTLQLGITNQAKHTGLGSPIIIMTIRHSVLKGMPTPLNTDGESYKKSMKFQGYFEEVERLNRSGIPTKNM
jgi:hypothetical protein